MQVVKRVQIIPTVKNTFKKWLTNIIKELLKDQFQTVVNNQEDQRIIMNKMINLCKDQGHILNNYINLII